MLLAVDPELKVFEASGSFSSDLGAPEGFPTVGFELDEPAAEVEDSVLTSSPCSLLCS